MMTFVYDNDVDRYLILDSSRKYMGHFRGSVWIDTYKYEFLTGIQNYITVPGCLVSAVILLSGIMI